jgi:hypothetical protein
MLSDLSQIYHLDISRVIRKQIHTPILLIIENFEFYLWPSMPKDKVSCIVQPFVHEVIG